MKIFTQNGKRYRFLQKGEKICKGDEYTLFYQRDKEGYAYPLPESFLGNWFIVDSYLPKKYHINSEWGKHWAPVRREIKKKNIG